MNTALTISRASRGSRRGGVTLIELLMALLIVLIFIGFSAMTVFHLIRTGEVAQARLDAVANARHALETMALEIKQARFGPVTESPLNLFVGTTTVATEGNRKDDDRDGTVDEEVVDGQPQGAWTAADDRHAILSQTSPPSPVTGVLYERQQFRNAADIGDVGVDVDARFSDARLSFRTFPSVFNPQPGVRVVSFARGTVDGDSSALLRTVVEDAGGAGERTTTSPIAFQVLSFSAVYYNGNTNPPRWQANWNAAPFPATDIELPVSVYLEVTCYAGTKPLAELQPGEPIDTVTLNTMVNIEAVLASPKYALQRPVYL